MIYLIHWPYRWLCRLGIHEYYVESHGWDDGAEVAKWGEFWECGVCGKRKPRA